MNARQHRPGCHYDCRTTTQDVFCMCWCHRPATDAPIHIDRRTPEQIAADRAADQYEASLEGPERP